MRPHGRAGIPPTLVADTLDHTDTVGVFSVTPASDSASFSSAGLINFV